MSNPSEDMGCLSSLGISVQSHESYELNVMEKIARKVEEKEKQQTVQRSRKLLLALGTELRILMKRRAVKERELNQLYSDTGQSSMAGGTAKRKVESLVVEQEKLTARILELSRNQTKCLEELKRCDYDVISDPDIKIIDTKVGLQDEDVEVDSTPAADETEETETQRDVRLGSLTAFGSSLESTSLFEPQAKLEAYLKTHTAEQTPSSKYENRKRKKGGKRKRQLKKSNAEKRKRLKVSESGSDYSCGEEGEEWLTDSSEDERGPSRRSAQDDGDKELYIARLKRWEKSRTPEEVELDGQFEKLKEGLKIPTVLWNRLFNYQRVAVQWMYELYQQRCGGILGDEMGLGKTVQVIAYLASLSCTRSSTNKAEGLGATMIVCPTTVLHQWVSELHRWWPPFRVGVLHTSGSFTGSKASLIRSINSCRGIIVMSYQAVVTHMDFLSSLHWEYIILDEGHKIRNPDAKVTLAVKQIATPHRLILSGSPLQNNLRELWSLFDFIYPGKLGTLPTFVQQFSAPITQGGYSNASEIQVATAFRCATVLKDTIGPYLLRRMKADVKQHINLPEKNEQVLFCKLTEEQRHLYRTYIDSRETQSILDGGMKVFIGLIALRKICNHPDLFYPPSREEGEPDQGFGWYKRSGKMLVIHSLLKIWKKQGHRVLLFTQSRQMLKVLESYAKSQAYNYVKMDGTTSVGSRQPLIDKFNGSPHIFLFLLTTRVGGLGINLTGADRVVIFDPDWNPSTDTQARERAWRIGQERQVTIYRLMTSGTIEEKIYHRQIYKQFLVNRVLKDPKQRRFFKSNDLYELFTLNETDNDKTETSAIFAGTGSDVKVTPVPSFKPKSRKPAFRDNVQSSLSRLYSQEAREANRKIRRIEKVNPKVLEKDSPARIEQEKFKVPQDETTEGTKQETSEQLKKEASDVLEKDTKVSEEDGTEGLGKDTLTEGAGPVSCLLSEEERRQLREKARRISAMFNRSTCTTPSRLEPGAAPLTSTPGGPGPRLSPRPSSSKAEKKEQRRKEKGARFEGERVSHLVKTRRYKPPLVDEEEEEKTAESQDNYVLARLFAKSGVHSAVQHDAIVDERTHDYAIIESEANRVAKEAIRALRISRQECMRAETGVPNWTGQNGSLKKKFGAKKTTISSGTLSSQDLLARMKNRNLLVSAVERPEEMGDSIFFPAGESGSQAVSQPVNQLDLDLLTDIRNFIAFQARLDGEASTAELVSKFQKALPSQKSPLFKAFLKQICDFRREDGGRGLWSLKSEFR